MRKKIAVCTSAIVAAASVGVCCRPVPAFADSSEYEAYIDAGIDLAQAAASENGLTNSVAQYFGMFCLLRACIAMNTETGDAVAMPTNNIGTVGRYYYNGEHKLGTALSYGGYRFFADQGQGFAAPIFECPDGEILVGVENVPASGVSISTGSANYLFSDWTTNLRFSVDSVGTFEGHYCGISVGSSEIDWSSVNATTSPAYIYRPGNETPSQIIGASVGFSAPSSGFVPGENVDYLNNVMLPYFRDIPEIEPYVPAPYVPGEPYEPIYPTGDFVTGVPKEWTVENPVLPTSPQMNIDIPNASLPDLSGLSQYTNGVGFWWSLTGWIMDTFGIREIVLLLIGLGVFAFVLYRLGAG